MSRDPNFQIQKGSHAGHQYVSAMKPVEKMISRDIKGNLGIVPIGYQNF